MSSLDHWLKCRWLKSLPLLTSRSGPSSSLILCARVVALDQIGGSFNNLISYWYYLRFGVGPAEIGLITGLSRFIASISFALSLKMAKCFGTINAAVMSRIPIFIITFLTPFIPSSRSRWGGATPSRLTVYIT
jgi:hypothetical protein